MNTHETHETEEMHQQEDATLWEQADEVVRTNPVPAIVTAVAVGFALGLLVRFFEAERRENPVRECLDDTSNLLGSFLRPLGKKSRRVADSVRESVRDAVEQAVSRAQDIDVDPITKWWKRLW